MLVRADLARQVADVLRAAAAVIDTHADVRKAAVITLAAWADRTEASDALERATKDIDADVRGYARRALAGR